MEPNESSTTDCTARTCIACDESITFSKKELSDKGDDEQGFVIEGWANTSRPNTVNATVEADAWTDRVLKNFMKNPLMFYIHDRYRLPIGKWTEVKRVSGKGLWAKGIVSPTSEGFDVMTLVEEGILKQLSVGFAVKEHKIDEKTRHETITEVDELYEISVCPIGADRHAMFKKAYAGDLSEEEYMRQYAYPADSLPNDPSKLKTTNAKVYELIGDVDVHSTSSSAGKGSNMADAPNVVSADVHELNKTVDELNEKTRAFESQFMSNSEAVKKLEESNDAINKAVHEMNGKLEGVQKGFITKAEFTEFAAKHAEETAQIQETQQKALAAIHEHKRDSQLGVIHRDFRDLANVKHIRDDSGNTVSETERLWYGIMEAPLADDMRGKDIVYAIRAANDAVVILNAYNRAQHNHNYHITQRPIYKALHDLVEKYYSAEFADAMAGANTGAGSEWVPTYLSDELSKISRLTPSIASLFEQWNMSSTQQKYPLLTGGANCYLNSEAAVMNPTEATKTNVTTSDVTFTSKTFIGLCPVSPELMEDSIVEMVPLIRNELGRSISEGLDSAIVNGDTTSTHRDTAQSYTYGVNVETAFMGLRYQAVDLSAKKDVGGAATTDFTATKMRGMRTVLSGSRGINSQNLVWIVPLNVYFQILDFNEMKQVGTYGAAATFATGNAIAFDGSPLIVTSKITDTMATDGVDDGDAETHTGLLLVDKTAFKVGVRRGITVEADKNIRTQQIDIAATMRPAFNRVTTSTDKPVCYGYNVCKA